MSINILETKQGTYKIWQQPTTNKVSECIRNKASASNQKRKVQGSKPNKGPLVPALPLPFIVSPLPFYSLATSNKRSKKQRLSSWCDSRTRKLCLPIDQENHCELWVWVPSWRWQINWRYSIGPMKPRWFKHNQLKLHMNTREIESEEIDCVLMRSKQSRQAIYNDFTMYAILPNLIQFLSHSLQWLWSSTVHSKTPLSNSTTKFTTKTTSTSDDH